MWCLDVRVKKETAPTMEAVWLMPPRHLLTCASVSDLGVDFDAKLKILRKSDSFQVSISDIGNKRKNAGTYKRTDLRKQVTTDELLEYNRTTKGGKCERGKGRTE